MPRLFFQYIKEIRNYILCKDVGISQVFFVKAPLMYPIDFLPNRCKNLHIHIKVPFSTVLTTSYNGQHVPLKFRSIWHLNAGQINGINLVYFEVFVFYPNMSIWLSFFPLFPCEFLNESCWSIFVENNNLEKLCPNLIMNASNNKVTKGNVKLWQQYIFTSTVWAIMVANPWIGDNQILKV